MKRWLISLSFAALFASLASAAFALPTVNDVQAQVKKGNFTEAQSMMREVVEARPSSAKAHYLYAEILAHNARFADAAEQARMAKELDPTLKFTDPDKFRSFEGLLDREQQRTAVRSAPPAAEQPRQSAAPVTTAPMAAPAEAPVQRSGGIPVWVWIGVAAVAFFAWRMMRTRAAPAMMPAGASYGPAAAAPSYGPGYTPNTGFGGGGMMQPGRGGSGLLGTGLAAAGGVAAGMMAEKWLEGNREHDANPGSAAFDSGDGSTVAPQRDEAAQALENRDIDFGSGNDWGGDAGSSDAGSFDSGSSGGGDDSW